jgi:HEXXH motif-containing protein
VAAAAPPTYRFPTKRQRAVREGKTAYSVSFFVDVANEALRRIAACWPELHNRWPDFVRILVHVPDGTFRSASAARYVGVVFLSADDGSLLEVEESLVHEFGHQVLYRVMELDRLLVGDDSTEYTLPWSGAKRDFYGYFHAFYIYVLLATYFARVVARGRVDEDAARRLFEHIASGLRIAARDFEPDDRFTARGRDFMAALLGNAERVSQSLEVGG